ncbi:MAG: Lrp/AsnC family transcriptional regulator [Parvibaculaceae bacterium]
MDEFDRKILDSLQKDSAASRARLAAEVGLSESQAVRRRQALEQTGVIRRYRADLDAKALGLTVTAFVHVKLKGHSDGNARRFRDLVRLTPGILEAHAVTGDFDYLLKLCVADLDALRDLVNGVLLMHPTVDRVRSEIVLEILRDDQLLAL